MLYAADNWWRTVKYQSVCRQIGCITALICNFNINNTFFIRINCKTLFVNRPVWSLNILHFFQRLCFLWNQIKNLIDTQPQIICMNTDFLSFLEKLSKCHCIAEYVPLICRYGNLSCRSRNVFIFCIDFDITVRHDKYSCRWMAVRVLCKIKCSIACPPVKCHTLCRTCRSYSDNVACCIFSRTGSIAYNHLMLLHRFNIFIGKFHRTFCKYLIFLGFYRADCFNIAFIISVREK